MYEYTCANCGKRVAVKTKYDLRKFCGKKCFGAFLHEQRARCIPQEGKPRSRDIHPDGLNNLICAIVRQAREDVMTYSPMSSIRQDAEDFFLSDWFEALTNLDGWDILDRLTREYEAKQRRKAERAMT